MSVLIKGMEMPTSCSECAFCGYYGNGEHMCDIIEKTVEYENAKTSRRDDCPLVPVPPHGRLIDADAAVVAIQNSIEVVHDGMQKILLDYAQKMFNATPTIIEAEEGE